jgi:L-rhamnose mutarotase
MTRLGNEPYPKVRGGAMRRVAFRFRVKPEKLAEYRELHRAVWPEMLDAHRRTGWHNYSLFASPDGQVFGYFETMESLEAALAGMEAEEVNARWDRFMEPYLESLELEELAEVFHLE